MTALTVALAVGLVLAVALVVLLLVTVIRHVAGRPTSSAANDATLQGALVAVPALMEAGRSDSGGQLNGNGMLAVFPTEVRFVLGRPRRSVVIDRASIRDVQVTRHLSLPGIVRAGGPPWLILEWVSPEGHRTTGFQTDQAQMLASLFNASPSPPSSPTERPNP